MRDNPKTQVVDSVEELLFAFVQVFQIKLNTGIRARASAVPGGKASLRFEAERRKYILDVWPRLNPSRQLLEGKPKDPKLSLLLCPHLPDALAADLRSKGINHADLNGRLFVKTPSFLLDREPKSGVYRNPSPEVNPFTLKSSRLVRVLLSHREQEWTQADLESRTDISRALVSLTLTDLIERELVEQTRAGTRHTAALYRVRNFNRLLDAWSAEDQWRKRVFIQQYSVLARDPVEAAETARDALGEDNIVFTQWFAAHLRHPYTAPPLVSAYVRRKPLQAITWARPVDNGGNLWLLTPKDAGVFQETQSVDGFTLVSDVQIFLDLLQVGQRGPEQAQALREWEGFAQ